MVSLTSADLIRIFHSSLDEMHLPKMKMILLLLILLQIFKHLFQRALRKLSSFLKVCGLEVYDSYKSHLRLVLQDFKAFWLQLVLCYLLHSGYGALFDFFGSNRLRDFHLWSVGFSFLFRFPFYGPLF